MRILFLNYEFPPIGGGGANANAYLFQQYANNPDFVVDCVTSTLDKQDQVESFAENITLHRLAVGKRELHFWTQREVLSWLRQAHRKVRELVSQHDYDVCHAFFGFPSGLVAWWYRAQVPYVLSLRGSDVPGFNPRFAFQYVFLKPLFRHIWQQASSVIANSQGLKVLANKFMPKLSIGVIPNGIDTQQFKPATAGTRVPQRILCVSRLVERKGVQHLIGAMPAIVASFPDVSLQVVGEGNLLDELAAQCVALGVHEHVDFLGYVPHEQLPEFYQKAELFVQPSFYEGMSNTVLEAMACGLPVIASGEGGREELLRDNALLAPYGDPTALAEGVTALLLNPEKLTDMGQVSREIAQYYSWAAVAKSYLNVYHDLLDSSHAPRAARHGL
ncbi:glycosyltransferase family 4 protein [Deltaproteobacteria bacterium IMCC39524]|nr:glycosyltransferase family 4 protein [Deltaproteobacteria bacterium IMCC39524]